MDSAGIYAAYYERVYRFLLGLSRNNDLAEDLTQETFLRAMKSADRFDGRCSIVTYLCSIARNLYMDHCRKQRKEQPLDDVQELTSPDWSDALLDREQALRVHRVLHELEESYKEVFSLRVFGELSHAEIGALFSKNENWSRITFYRAKVLLQHRLMEESHE